MLESPSGPSWLKRLYRPLETAAGGEGQRAAGATTRSQGDGAAEGRTEEADDSDAEEEGEKGSAEEAQARARSQGLVARARREGEPFAARIAAHASCTRKLWRARYLALREVRWARVLFVPCLGECRRGAGLSVLRLLARVGVPGEGGARGVPVLYGAVARSWKSTGLVVLSGALADMRCAGDVAVDSTRCVYAVASLGLRVGRLERGVFIFFFL